VAILARPRAAYAALAHRVPRGDRRWIAARRPWYAALLLGATVSLLVTGTLTVRLVLGGALTWSFVPFFEAASLAVVSQGRPSALSRARALDLYFAGRGAWSLALIALGAVAACSPPLVVYFWASSWRQRGLLAAFLFPVAAWSAYVDFCFFRVVLEYSWPRALRRLAAQRALSWTASLVYFAGMALSPYIVGIFRG
jgi:hypothetical protein